MSAPTVGRQVAPALADFIMLNEEIVALVQARLPLESHLAQVGAELPGQAGRLAERIGRRMEAGDDLASAMEAECASLPPVYRAVVLAGVQSGQLGAALESLVDTASRREQLRRVTGMAVIYPLTIIVVACLLLAVVISQIVPTFGWLNVSHYGPLAQLAYSPAVVWLIAIAIPISALLLAASWWRRSSRLGGHRSNRFGALAWLPWASRVHHWGQAATLADLSALLVGSGLPLERALRLAADATDNARLRAAGHELADRTRDGASLVRSKDEPDAVGSHLPPLIRLALYHTSNRAMLQASLAHAAGVYRERAIRLADGYAEFLPVVLTLGIGGTLTMLFTLAVFWPYASMLHELSGASWR